MQRAPVPEFGFNIPGQNRQISQQEETFYSAVAENKKTLESLLKAGHDTNHMDSIVVRNWLRQNPLWVALNDFDQVELLIKYGADVNILPYIGGVLAISPILSEKYPEKDLVDWEKNAGKGITNIRTEKKVYNIIKLLLKHGANPNVICPEAFPSYKLSTEEDTIRYFKENGIRPIDNAIRRNLFSIVELLVEHGTKLDDQSIIYAKKATAASGNPEMENYIRKLIDK